MPAPFKRLTLDAFARVLEQFPFTRRINAVHMHHTWRPDHRQFRGHDSVVAMWRYHTAVNGWADIAQHITIAPDGGIWLGRNWNLPPASASGHNGNMTNGPFMFETVGNFDRFHDKLEGEQRRAVIEVIARVQKRFALPPGSLVFHNAMSTKTCPGSGVSLAEILAEVAEQQRALAQEAPREVARGPFASDALEIHEIVERSIELLNRPVEYRDAADAEHDDEGVDTRAAPAAAAAARDSGLAPGELEALRPHLVNLNMGAFSSEGEAKTTQGDVDAIFEQHLPRALNAAKAAGVPLRIVMYAHGGLVSESDGLRIAHKHVSWWSENGVYPIYFVWETGGFETIGQLIRRGGERTARALERDIFDHTTDLLIEATARALQGPRIWGGMKLSAELACTPNRPGRGGTAREGGAHYVARRLAEFCKAHAGEVEVHAVGHSAGSIFHSHFMPAALDAGAPAFTTAHFMAPAVTCETFKGKLINRLGDGVKQLTLYTMSRPYEQDDNCASVYRKSLLYLIHYALEPERSTPILGLEVSLRGDETLKKALGLAGEPAHGEVVWSVSASPAGRSASTSTTHGGFDDDPATMNSIVRRITGKDDADRIVEYRADEARSARDPWADAVDWPEALRLTLRPPAAPARPPAAAPAAPQPAAAAAATTYKPGRKRALCVGINRYPTAPLAGCVADATLWASTLQSLGFEAQQLFDDRATLERITGALTELVTTAAPGDILVFQYSGHGTQLPDINGDEAQGDTPGKDEAICPYDFASGAFLIDDDIGEVFKRLPAGVNLTCFIDCCHSGTISRFAVGSPAPDGAPDERPRFIVATPEMIAAHRQYRAGLGGTRAAAAGSGGLSRMKEVLFTACLSSEVAWESEGQGEFTRRAIPVLRNGAGRISNRDFEQQVIQAFGANPRQHARLYCDVSREHNRLLEPIASAAAAPVLGTAGSRAGGDTGVALGQRVEVLLREVQKQAE